MEPVLVSVSSTNMCNKYVSSSFEAYPSKEGKTKKLNLCCITKKYPKLTLVQRYQIEALKKVGLKQFEIVITMRLQKSTVSWELKRNIPKRRTGAKVYATQKLRQKLTTGIK